MADLDGITAEQVMDGITRALQARDFPAVVSLIKTLAIRDPDAARQVLDAFQLVRTDRAAAALVLDVLNGDKTLTISGSEARIHG